MSLQPLAAGSLGTDVDSSFGVPLRWGLATGPKNLGNAIARRLSAARGTLFYDESYGYDLRGSLNAGFTKTQIAGMQSAITAEVEKDERVQSCDTSVVYTFATSSLQVKLIIDPGDGPFELILLVTDVTIEILNGNQPTAQAVATADGSAPAATVIVGVPGPPGAPGTGPGTGGGAGTIEVPFNWLKRTTLGTEELLDEQTVDFNNLAAGVLTADLSGAGLSGAGSATARVYVNSVLGDFSTGLVGSVSISSVGIALFTPMSVPFNNPTGTRLVKITLQSSGAGVQAQLLNPMVGFS